MSLDYQYGKIANWKEVTTSPFNDKEWNPVTWTLTMLTLSCGYREITEQNAEKVASRIMAYQAVAGGLLNGNPGEARIYITADDVRLHIGLKTNASVMSDSQWLKHLGEIAMQEGRYIKQEKSAHALCAEKAASNKAKAPTTA